jgi:hypothetical protein
MVFLGFEISFHIITTLCFLSFDAEVYWVRVQLDVSAGFPHIGLVQCIRRAGLANLSYSVLTLDCVYSGRCQKYIMIETCPISHVMRSTKRRCAKVHY